MNISRRVRITAYGVVLAYSAALLLNGITLPTLLSKALTSLPFFVVGAFALFDNFLWKLGPLPKFVKQPVIGGTWHGTLTSYRRNDAGKQLTSQHEVVLVVRQSLTDISVTMLTAESKSRSDVATITSQQSDDYVLQYQYRNDPRMAYRDTSPIHVGGALVEIAGARPQSLYAEYWTSRDTRGSYNLAWVSKEKARDFDHGRNLASTVRREGGQ